MKRSIRAGAKALTLVLMAGVVWVGAADSQIAAGTLPPDEIVRRLEAAGYKSVHDVEFDDGRYEAEATSPTGTAVELEVDPVTGKVTQEDAD